MVRQGQVYGKATLAVVEVLNNLGYTNEPDTSKLPNGWRSKVVSALARLNIQVHDTTIYQTRIREVERKQKQKLTAHPNNPKPPEPLAPKKADDDLTGLDVKLDDVIAIANFAKQYGGMKQLGKMISFIAKHPIADLLKV